ncbi:hypothetical protein J010_05654 [Cryptococcus neoformans]|nr:hypothetical protein C353_04335 [Cryptococcus neoformans var. grubii AD1-83a]OXG56078.1 hypothetical protein C352_05237 [Cryptococcus neoformans var. grubii CHC193]OXH03512.1 hypothetical protein J010_05654 [Cryptococcus neoformans var. grubii]
MIFMHNCKWKSTNPPPGVSLGARWG